MKYIAHRLLRLSLLVALLLAPATQSVADARTPQQIVLPCKPVYAEGAISGTVRDGTDRPLYGVTVTAYATTGATLKAVATNAAGEYKVTPLPVGSYLLEFRPLRGPTHATWYSSGTSPLDATSVEVKLNETTSGIDARLPAGVEFNVALRDSEGKPVPQSVITVFDRSGHPVAYGLTGDTGRTLTAPGLPLGSYRLSAHPPSGSALLEQFHNQQPTLDAADVLTVTQASSVDVPMTLRRGTRLSGTVTETVTGAPLAGIEVQVVGMDYNTRTATTDAQGKYSVEGVPSGTHRVYFNPDKSKPNSPAPLRRLVTFSAPNAQAGFDAALVRGGAITGRVTDPSGAPLGSATVQVFNEDDSSFGEVYTAPNGTYAIHGLPSGRYTLAFSHSDHLGEYYNDRQDRALADQVAVTAPNTVNQVNAVLKPGGAVSGKVTDSDGNPIAGVSVSILDRAAGKAPVAYARTNANGDYTTTTTIPSGSYSAKFQPPSSDGPCGLVIEYSGNSPTAAAATPVFVSAPSTATGIDAALEYGGYITGRLTDAASGLPMNGSVEVYDATGALVVTGYARRFGHYRAYAALPPGAYRVRFVAPGYVPMFYGGATTLEAATTVTSGAGDVSIALARGGTLTGRITAADTGAPLEYAAVTLYDTGDRVVATQVTDFDGSYGFEGILPSGQYRIGVAPGKKVDGTPYFTGYEPVFTGGATSLAAAQPIGLVAPQTLNADLAMPSTSAPPPTTPTTPSPTGPTPTPTTPGQSPKKQLYLPLVQR